MALSATTVGSLATQLKKALDNHHSSIVDDVLTQLKLMVATADLLKSTGVGVAVNKVRKHEAASADQKLAAKALVAKWKNDVNGAAGDIGSEPSRKVPAAVAAAKQEKGIQVETRRIVPPPRRQSSISGQTTPSSATAGRTLESDGLKAEPTGDDLRDKCVGLFYQALAATSTKDGTRLLRMAQELEQRTFDETKSTDAQYKNRVKTLKFNLSDPNNPDLVAAVLRGAIPIEMLSNMSTADMASAERKAEIKAAEKIALDNATTVEDTQAETDWFQCSKCKMRKTKYYQMVRANTSGR
ncbi:RNA polymerase II elongation factor [Geranomyces variabilis]|uniref:RNA polymerase II elongation factor n=1 Tax=Geranomyces variabilis TaxID=109894 RepID=A0AAD5XRM4_9FUNG|nr:RNA polymerase II elongation factor [Geranomyces variabilis]